MGKEKPLNSIQRAVQQALGDGRIFGHPEDPARDKWPELWAWLSSTDAGRDHVKQPATIKISLAVDGVHASLTDRDLACSIPVAVDWIEGVFDALEQALNRPNPPMQTWGRKEPNLRKRRKSG